MSITSLSDFLLIQDRVDVADTFKAFLLQVTRSVIDAHKHQRYPQRKILEELGVPAGGRLSRIMSFRVVFRR